MSNQSEIVKSLCTISEMLTDRGITCVEKYISYSETEIEQLTSNRLVFHIDLDDIKMRIVYNLAQKFKYNEIKGMYKPEIKSYLFVSKEKVNANEVKKLEETFSDYQLFELKELTFNITKHHYVPKHELLLDEALIKEIESVYHLKSKNQLPLILKNDPMAKYLNAKPGQIVKVTRYSPTSGEHVVYRSCV